MADRVRPARAASQPLRVLRGGCIAIVALIAVWADVVVLQADTLVRYCTPACGIPQRPTVLNWMLAPVLIAVAISVAWISLRALLSRPCRSLRPSGLGWLGIAAGAVTTMAALTAFSMSNQRWPPMIYLVLATVLDTTWVLRVTARR